MRILCVADQVDPLVYSAAVKERFKDVEMVLSAGDLPMEYLGFIASSLNKPILFVFGNHNLKHLPLFRKRAADEARDVLHDQAVNESIFRNYFGSTYIGFKARRQNKLLFAGLGGCKRYNNGENQFTETEMIFRILRMAPRLLFNRIFFGRYVDILLAHAAPQGINDQPDPTHTGFKAFLWFMDTFKPRYLIHGHIHLYDLNARRVAHYKQTTIINVFGHYVLDVANEELEDRS